MTKQQFQIRSTGCDSTIPPVVMSNQEESLITQVLNVANNSRKGQTGAVFAVVAMKLPPCAHSEKIKLNHRMHACQQKSGISPQQELKTLEAGKKSCLNKEIYLNKSPGSKKRQTVVPSLPAQKRESKADEPGFGAKDPSLVRLEPREHECLVKSAMGCWSQLYSLLLQDVHLAEKRNFISGFTALHWAAKHGNSKMVRKIFDAGQKVDVNIKSYDGYTPLHVAAIHSHESVLKLLVHGYGANCNIRDNSGRKAYHYLRKDLPAEVRELLGDPAVSCQNTEQVYLNNRHLPDMSKNLNTFSKLFQASVGHRKKSRYRSSFRLISAGQDEKRKDCMLGH